MEGRILGLLSGRLQSMKNKSGDSPKLAVFFAPRGGDPDNDDCELFWRDLCAEKNIPWLDLAPPFNTLKTSYYPTGQSGGWVDFTVYGNSLVSLLLTEELIRDNWIPFKAPLGFIQKEEK